MKKKKFTKTDSALTTESPKAILSGFTPMMPYSNTKRHNPSEIDVLMKLLPIGYLNKQKENIELIEPIYSANTNTSLITLAVGRNDRDKSKECFRYRYFQYCSKYRSDRVLLPSPVATF